MLNDQSIRYFPHVAISIISYIMVSEIACYQATGYCSFSKKAPSSLLNSGDSKSFWRWHYMFIHKNSTKTEVMFWKLTYEHVGGIISIFGFLFCAYFWASFANCNSAYSCSIFGYTDKHRVKEAVVYCAMFHLYLIYIAYDFKAGCARRLNSGMFSRKNYRIMVSLFC